MWIFIALIASVFQTFRNGFQRSLTVNAGIWAATWVRFAFGIPITIIVFIISSLIGVHHANLGHEFWLYALLGAIAQIVATAMLLKAIEASGFAIGVALQHSALVVTALYGVIFLHDNLSIWAWLGVFIASFGMIIANWPKDYKGIEDLKKALPSAFYGFLSGVFFAVCTNAFRLCVLSIEHKANVFSGTLSVLVVQIMQAIGLGLILFIWQRSNFFVALREWKSSFGAGSAGASASVLWFFALGLAPAAMVRAVNLLTETPLSIIWGMIKFKEKVPLYKIAALIFIVGGVIIMLMSKRV